MSLQILDDLVILSIQIC